MQTASQLTQRWIHLEEQLHKRFGRTPDIETILFLIGIQETGKLHQPFSKEEKQDLMHVGLCCILLPSGYFEPEKTDANGWPHFRLLKPLPPMSLDEQERFLKEHILLYFEKNGFGV
ncbi:MAG: hypothetical protein N2747_10300 [Chitinophagaceae bacterium]|nr:hypothetical protein [Chitinophagaceae bacterium]